MEEQKRIDRTVRALTRNGISADFFTSEDEARKALISYIVPGMSVGVGDSETLSQLGVYDLLRTQDVRFLDKYDTSLTRQQKKTLYRQNFYADLFLSGINALTMTGKIYNLDGNGSRVAPIIYGPEKVLLVCGTNKIVADDEEAVTRIKTVAAPADARRLGKRTPCVKTGRCADCTSPDRICNYYSIIQGQFDRSRIRVLLIDGVYGF